MKRLGIIGGIAPGSTVDYYQSLIAQYRTATGDGHYPPLLINSIDMTHMLSLVGAGQLTELTHYLLVEVERLARAGAEFGLLASNTPHVVFDDLARLSPIPLLSIVDSAAAAARERGLRTVGLLGTRFTMEGGFYPEVFGRSGIAVRLPRRDEQRYIHDVYMRELTQGYFRAETRERVVAVIRALARDEGIEAALLAGTELPLLVRQSDVEVPLLDTTRLHVARALEIMLDRP